MKTTNFLISMVLLWVALLIGKVNAQTVIANYNFNGVTSYPVSPSATATDITSSITSTETFQTYSGTATASQAFVSNSTAGDALSMSNSSGTNSRYWTATLGGSDLENYKSYRIYVQARRSPSGAQKLTLYYSTDGTTFSTYAFMNPGYDTFVEYLFDLTNITNIDLQSAVYFKLAASEATGSGTLRIDNLQIQAIKVINGVTESFSTDTLFVHDRLKIGNSIIFEQENNSMFTDSTSPTALNIQSVQGLNHNTVINNGNSGKVAIGKSIANDKLDVDGAIRSGNNTGYVRTGFNSLHSFIDGFDTLTYGGLLINYYSGEDVTVGCDGTGGRRGNFTTNNDARLAFLSGNVTIGGGSNSADLEVKGDIMIKGLKADSGTTSFVKVDEWGMLYNQDLPGACASLSCTGNAVGINTDSPSEALEVQHGDIYGGIALNQTIAGSSRHSEIKFNKNGVQKWSLGNDFNRTGTQTFFIWDHANNATRFYIDSTGYVGFGTTAPTQKLEVSHNDSTGGIVLNQKISGSNMKSEIKFNKNGQQKWAIGNDLHRTGKQTFFINDYDNNATRFFIDTTGYVGFGTEQPKQKIDVNGNIVCMKMAINDVIPANDTSIYRLFVDGGIKTRDVKITASGWADHVFDNNYKLMGISELEDYINSHKHLPGIPSAKEIDEKEGYEIGDMQKKLLEKLEEQALYIIMLQKQIDELKLKIKE